MRSLTIPRSVPGMATKGFLTAAESSGVICFPKLVLITITLNKRSPDYSC